MNRLRPHLHDKVLRENATLKLRFVYLSTQELRLHFSKMERHKNSFQSVKF